MDHKNCGDNFKCKLCKLTLKEMDEHKAIFRFTLWEIKDKTYKKYKCSICHFYSSNTEDCMVCCKDFCVSYGCHKKYGLDQCGDIVICNVCRPNNRNNISH